MVAHGELGCIQPLIKSNAALFCHIPLHRQQADQETNQRVIRPIVSCCCTWYKYTGSIYCVCIQTSYIRSPCNSSNISAPWIGCTYHTAHTQALKTLLLVSFTALHPPSNPHHSAFFFVVRVGKRVTSFVSVLIISKCSTRKEINGMSCERTASRLDLEMMDSIIL